MPVFTSSREKRLWLYALLVLIAIISTLIFGASLLPTMDQDLRGALVFLTLIAVAATVILHGLITRPGKAEMTIWLGLSAVYIMLYIRLEFAERTHLFEYSVLAIFIHKALIERARKRNQVFKPALLALFITLITGVLDECIQIFLPRRVFDPIDMLFNSLAAFMAIGASMLILWVRKRF